MKWIDKSKGLKESECIHYNDLINRNLHKQELLRQGFKFINRTNKYKKIIAYALIGFGCITLPLPTGSVILIGLGLGMLGLKKDDIRLYYKRLIYKRNAKRLNLYYLKEWGFFYLVL